MIEIPCKDELKSELKSELKNDWQSIELQGGALKTDLRSELKSELKGELKSELKTIKIILDLIRENPEATIDVLVKKSGKSRTTVQKCVRKLKEGLCIEREGGKNGGHWKLLI